MGVAPRKKPTPVRATTAASIPVVATQVLPIPVQVIPVPAIPATVTGIPVAMAVAITANTAVVTTLGDITTIIVHHVTGVMAVPTAAAADKYYLRRKPLASGSRAWPTFF